MSALDRENRQFREPTNPLLVVSLSQVAYLTVFTEKKILQIHPAIFHLLFMSEPCVSHVPSLHAPVVNIQVTPGPWS